MSSLLYKKNVMLKNWAIPISLKLDPIYLCTCPFMSVGLAATPTMSKMTNGIKFHKKVSLSFKSVVKLKQASSGIFDYPRQNCV